MQDFTWNWWSSRGNKFGITKDVEDGVLTGDKYFHREIDVGNM